MRKHKNIQKNTALDNKMQKQTKQKKQKKTKKTQNKKSNSGKKHIREKKNHDTIKKSQYISTNYS